MELQKMPVYKFYLAKMSLAALTLPMEQKQEAALKHNEFMTRVGGRVLLAADCVWSNEEFSSFGFEEFPSLDALIEYSDCLKELNWFGYFQTKSYLGWLIDDNFNLQAFTPPPPPEPGTQPIYKAYLARMTPYYLDNKKPFEAIVAKELELKKKIGIVPILMAYSRMNNEEWMGFGLERYPSLDAFAQHYQYFEESGWYRYMEAKTYLGKATDGTVSGLDA